MRPGKIFSVSGLGTARSAGVYAFLEEEVPRRYPDANIQFVGCPFAGWPHPLKWSKEERNSHASTRLLTCWAALNEFVLTRVLPLLDEGVLVVTEGFGLDAVLRATAVGDSIAENEAAELMHHGALVPMRIKQQNIPLPQYIIPRTRPEAVSDAWLQNCPQLRNVDPDVLRRFVEHEAIMLERYFDPKHGQLSPIWLDASLPREHMCEIAIGHMVAQAQLLLAA